MLPRAVRDEIERELSFFLTLDPFVEQASDRRYFVRSLYFDNAAWSCYHDKVDGMLQREKFRLRTYPRDADSGFATFLEVKGRHDALVFKHRAPLGVLSLNEFDDFGTNIAELVLNRTQEGAVLNRFQFQVDRMRISPVVRIDYFRRPYFSRFDPEFRLSFDEELTATASRTIVVQRSDHTRRILPGYSVLEIKFRRHVPSWFHRIIQSYNLRRVSISKCCKGVEVLGLVPNLD